MLRYKQRLHPPRCLCFAGVDQRRGATLLDQWFLDIKQKDENEVWLTFLFLSSSPSSRQDRYKTLVLPKVPSPAQS